MFLLCSMPPNGPRQPRSRRGARACAAREPRARRTLAARLAQAVAPSSWMDDISVSKGSDGGLDTAFHDQSFTP